MVGVSPVNPARGKRRKVVGGTLGTPPMRGNRGSQPTVCYVYHYIKQKGLFGRDERWLERLVKISDGSFIPVGGELVGWC